MKTKTWMVVVKIDLAFFKDLIRRIRAQAEGGDYGWEEESVDP